MYNIELIVLDGCPYCIATEELLKNKNVQYDLIRVNQKNKEKFKNDEIQTFPQIYLIKKNSNGKLLLGGYTDLKKVLEILEHKNLDKTIKDFQKYYPNWSKKAILRLAEIIIKK